MSSLSAAIYRSGTLDVNDVAFWERVAEHFREKLTRMSGQGKKNVFTAQSLGVKSPKRYAHTLLSAPSPSLPRHPGFTMMNAINGNLSEQLPMLKTYATYLVNI
jgi:hypothetical protein